MLNSVMALNNAMETMELFQLQGGRSYFNCNEIKSSTLTIAMLINEAVKVGYCYCRLFIALRHR